MSWLAPWALAAAAVVAASVALLHLLARDRPARYTLPTTRFVNPGTARAMRRARTPRDLPLLALRALALLLAGAAFAGPVPDPRGGTIGRVVILDAGAGSALRDSARGLLREGDRLVHFDSSLSAGLIAGMRAAQEVATAADSVSLVVVSPLLDVEDAATMRIRDRWDGRITLVTPPRVAAADPAPEGGRDGIAVRGPAADPLVAGARLAGARAASRTVDRTAGALIVRDAPSAADSAFARSGGALVLWLARDDAGRRTSSVDTIGGFVVDDVAVVFGAVRTTMPPDGRVIARWIDGRPAITETPLDGGCVRHVAVPVPRTGDLVLRPTFQRALRSIAAPCRSAARPASDTLRAALDRAGPLAAAGALRGDATRSPLTPWLLGAALALLLLEPLLRRRGARDRAAPAVA